MTWAIFTNCTWIPSGLIRLSPLTSNFLRFTDVLKILWFERKEIIYYPCQSYSTRNEATSYSIKSPTPQISSVTLHTVTNLFKKWSVLGTPAKEPQAKQRVSSCGKPFCSYKIYKPRIFYSKKTFKSCIICLLDRRNGNERTQWKRSSHLSTHRQI